VVRLENVAGHSLEGSRCLALHYQGLASGRYGRVETATFIPSQEVAATFDRRGYRLLASPSLYPGQTLRARLSASEHNHTPVQACLYIKHYDEQDKLATILGQGVTLEPGGEATLTWRAPHTGSYPIAQVGVQVTGNGGQNGTLYLDYLTWEGAPHVILDRPAERQHRHSQGEPGPLLWKRAWVDGFDGVQRLTGSDHWPEPYRLVQNRGRGILMQGTRQWQDYQVTARMTPHMCQAGGVAVRVQGMQRYYALLLDQDKTYLVRVFEGQGTILAQVEGGWQFGLPYNLDLQVVGNHLAATVNGVTVLQAEDPEHLFAGGGIGLVCEVGRIGRDHVEVKPV